MPDLFDYEWFAGSLTPNDVLGKCAALYSEHYGFWSERAKSNAGRPIRLSATRLRDWVASPDSQVALAYMGSTLIGYAIVVRTRMPRFGIVSWVTQFVVHEKYRNKGVGKNLLYRIWGLSDHFAWGLTTANPYAIRALEKATRRRCNPERIQKHTRQLMTLALGHVPYVTKDTIVSAKRGVARINTEFFLDHSTLGERISRAGKDALWTLGQLEEGWEWFAFTFNDQEPIRITREEIDEMLRASDEVTRRAYSRMVLEKDQKWMRHGEREGRAIQEFCDLSDRSRVFDFGCGTGRHVIELACRGLNVTGIDYVPEFITRARELAVQRGAPSSQFVVEDCRTVELGEKADAIICLYDVVGTYVDNAENLRILMNIVGHLKPGGRVLISVMNRDLTERLARRRFSLHEEPDALLKLPPSRTMELSGDVFDPTYYMLDDDSGVVYRKEQFEAGRQLPEEVIVRDRRFTKEEIEGMCSDVGLTVVWSRFVRAGAWDKELRRDDPRAKEILLLCRKGLPE